MKINVLREIHLDSFVKNQVTKSSTYVHTYIYIGVLYI